MNHFDWQWTQAGYQLYAQGWVPDSPKAVIALVHGFGEHGGRYERLAARLGREGYAVVAIDQFGHGKSNGPRGYAPSLDASLDSIESLLNYATKRHAGLPVFLYGHSMGGNMVLNYLLRRQPTTLRGAIVSAPWMMLGFEPPKFKLVLASVMKNIYPKFPEKAAIDTTSLSRDKEEVKKYDSDPLVHGTARAGTFSDTYEAGAWAMANAKLLTVPLLLLHGTSDRLISIKGSDAFATTAPKQLLTYIRYEGYYHELHNEPEKDRERVMLDEIKWLEGQMA